MRVKLGGVTTGKVRLGDVLSEETWERRDEMVSDYYEWYYGIDENKQNVADRTLTPIVESLANSNGDATILYSIRKQSKADCCLTLVLRMCFLVLIYSA